MSSITQDHDFSSSSADASLTYPLQASALRSGGYIIIKSHPCRITTLSTCKPGKHGHAKVSITAIDIFTSKKYEESHPAHATVDVPYVVKKEFLLLHIAGGFLSLWDKEKGEPKDDVRSPEGEMGEKVGRMWDKGEKDVMIMVLMAMGREEVEGVKEVDME